MEEPYQGVNDQPLYGVTTDNRPKPIGERLSEMFQPSDFVRVINIDNEDFQWQAMNPKDETYFMEPGPQKTTVRGKPRVYTIKAAQSLVLEGWNAQIMIEQLYKKVSAKAILARKTAPRDGKPTDIPLQWGDSEKQDFYVQKIFIGIETPSFGGYSTASPTGNADYKAAAPLDSSKLNTVDDIAKELGLDEQSSEG